MLKIYPKLEFSAKCPHDDSILEIKNLVIPGMFCLADTVCPHCDREYYTHVPVAHALGNSVTLNKNTGEIHDTEDIKWFKKTLNNSFLSPIDSTILPKVHKFFESERIIILNCLDFLYGHCLLKLLNTQRYLDNNPELGCCVLVPSQLVHLVPDGVAEIWEFPVPIKECWKWYPSLQSWIEEQITQRKECFLSPAYSHPSNKVYDLDCFVRDLPDISEKITPYQPIILWSYREDRLWGKSLQQQQRNIQKLYQDLSKVFPDLAFVLVGFGDKMKIKETAGKVIDLRTNQFNVECDRAWMAYMKVADCAIGVHGSNMLLPSGLAKSTIELVPRSRLGNIFQATLFSSEFFDLREAFLKYRYLYGDNELMNVSPQKVLDLIISLIGFQERASYLFTQGEDKSINLVAQSSNLSEIAQTYYLKSLGTIGIKKRIKRKLKKMFQKLGSFLETAYPRK